MGDRYGYTDIDNNLRSLWQKKTCGPEGAWEEQGWWCEGMVFQDCYKDQMIIYGQKCKLPVWRGRGGERQTLGYDKRVIIGLF